MSGATVAIVGAGLAGLRAATLLESRGFEVALFEAGARFGGRVFTARPAPGVAYEAGGEWIDGDHARMRSLLAALGAPARPADPTDGWVVIGGERAPRSLLWSDAQEDEDRVFHAGRVAAEALARSGWAGEAAERADRRTLASFVEEHARTPRGRTWMDVQLRGDEGVDLDQVGLLGWLLGLAPALARGGGEGGAYGFSIASDAWINRLVAQLRGEVRLGARVGPVRPASDGGALLEMDGRERRFSKVVLAVPPTTLGMLAPRDLPPRKQRAIAATGPGRVLKVALHYASPWWESFGGRIWTDGAVQQTWQPVCREGHVLIAYTCGVRADHLLAGGDPVGAVHRALTELFPEARTGLLGGWAHDWRAEPLARLAHVHLRMGIGADGEHLAAAAAPVGPVHFAGSWTAAWHGFMEGALESAERVVDEMTRHPWRA